MRERVVQINGLEIVSEAFGDPAHAPILLIMGGGASMLWWPQEFCEQLAAHRRYVIRYDQRETGRSTPYTPDASPFTLDDLASDVIHVLDGYQLPAAHLIGMSLGGQVGQLAALNYPSCVLSLTAISTSPVGMNTSHLPGSSAAYNQHLALGETLDWSDRVQVIAHMVGELRLVSGPAHPFDEAQARSIVEQDYDRAGGYPSSSNFVWKGGEEWEGRLHELPVPLLVIHGTADPVYPIEHGIALSQAVADANLIRLEGSGHELHRSDWGTIVAAIVKHTEPIG